jgi:hypothetical protein
MEDSRISSYSQDEHKISQLLVQFISKTAQVLITARVNRKRSKANKWQAILLIKRFNLELQEDEVLREELRFWKGQVNSGIVPAMSIDIFIDISGLKRWEYLVLEDQSTKRRHRIAPESLMTADHDGKVQPML